LSIVFDAIQGIDEDIPHAELTLAARIDQLAEPFDEQVYAVGLELLICEWMFDLKFVMDVSNGPADRIELQRMLASHRS
jgi:hypothetical protein